MTTADATPGFGWSVASLALSLLASIRLIVAPIGSERLLDTAGVAGAVALLYPIVITATAVLLHTHARANAIRKVAALLFLPLLFIGGFSIGPFYWPAALTMLVAGSRRP